MQHVDHNSRIKLDAMPSLPPWTPQPTEKGEEETHVKASKHDAHLSVKTSMFQVMTQSDHYFTRNPSDPPKHGCDEVKQHGTMAQHQPCVQVQGMLASPHLTPRGKNSCFVSAVFGPQAKPLTPEENMAMENHPFLLGDTSSNGCFSVVMLVFRGVTSHTGSYKQRNIHGHKQNCSRQPAIQHL